jgi:hypothetical protein
VAADTLPAEGDPYQRKEAPAMISDHPTVFELLRSLAERGAMRRLARRVLAHLARVEPACEPTRHALEEADRRAADRAARDYSAAFAAAAARTESATRRLAVETAEAGRDLERLLAAQVGERRDLYDRSRTKYRGAAFAEKLLAEARASASRSAGESLELAGVGLDVTRRLDEQTYGVGFCRCLALRAEALFANALRAAGELVPADRRWRVIAAHLAAGPLDDAAAEAELASLEASLRFDQRRLEEAAALAARAVRLYRRAGDRAGEGRALIQQANATDLAGNPGVAADLLRAALAVLDAVADARDYLMALNNLCLCLCHAGEFAAAAEVVAANRPLYEALGDAWVRSRLAWLEARIARGLSNPEDAERHLRAALNAYLGEGNGFNAALTALDVGRLLLEQCRTVEVKRIAFATHRAFADREVHPEAVEAIRLFARAAAAEKLTVELIDRLRARLESAAPGPGATPPVD